MRLLHVFELEQHDDQSRRKNLVKCRLQHLWQGRSCSSSIHRNKNRFHTQCLYMNTIEYYLILKLSQRMRDKGVWYQKKHIFWGIYCLNFAIPREGRPYLLVSFPSKGSLSTGLILLQHCIYYCVCTTLQQMKFWPWPKIWHLLSSFCPNVSRLGKFTRVWTTLGIRCPPGKPKETLFKVLLKQC